MEEMMSEANAYRVAQVAAGEAQISETVEIEDALIMIKAAERKIDHLKALKQKRVSSIDEQMTKEETRILNLRTAIQACMQARGEKNLDFPDVGKCTISKKKGAWSITDELTLEQELQKRGLLDSVSELARKMHKKDLNKLLDELEKNLNVPAGVIREENGISISIRFSDEVDKRAREFDMEKATNVQSQALPELPSQNTMNGNSAKESVKEYDSLVI